MAPTAYLPPQTQGAEHPEVSSVADSLLSAAPRLRALSSGDVAAMLGEVHAEWAAPKSRRRTEAVERLVSTTGYARAALDRSLRHLFGTLSEPALRHWVDISSKGRELVGPPLIGVIAAGNLPGTAIPSLVQALLLGSVCLVKSSSAEPDLMPLYAHSVACRSSELASAMAVMIWSREDTASTAALLQAVHGIIAYGSDSTLSELRGQYPEGRPFIGYGHRISFSVIGGPALSRRRAAATARKTALDLAMFDQQGCLSPQAIYVERGAEVSSAAFAGQLAAELERLRTLLPRRRLSAEESSAIHQFRAEFEMRSLVRRGARLWQSEGGTAWTVVLAPSLALEACPLNRTAMLHPFDTQSEVVESVSARRGHLISCGLAERPRGVSGLQSALSQLGVTRFCRLGEAQFPTAEEILLHDGVNPLEVLSEFS